MGDDQATRDWVRRIHSEFIEMPGLRLTRVQAQRLWALEPHVCEQVLDALVSAHLLERTATNAYVLAGASRP